jgi:hypothetical protein
MSTPPVRVDSINLKLLDLTRVSLQGLDDRFSKEEEWNVTHALPPDKVPGPDGFTARFLQVAWQIISLDVMLALDAIGRLDTRSLHELNGGLMVLLPKSAAAITMKDYMSISLIHCLGKLVSKILAARLAKAT